MIGDPKVFLVGIFALAAVACGHDIGDKCSTSVDCSQAGDRLCDITQPDGYCTVFNCEPDSCPKEAACVVFNAALSNATACEDPNGLSRFARSFCLFKCSSNDDCRSGYECQDFSPDRHPNDWDALSVDTEGSGKVCVVSHASKPVDPNVLDPFPDNVCSGTTTSGGSSSLPSGGASGMSSGGSGGMSSAGSSGAPGSDAGAGGAGG
jgi:hypothetical protein